MPTGLRQEGLDVADGSAEVLGEPWDPSEPQQSPPGFQEPGSLAQALSQAMANRSAWPAPVLPNSLAQTAGDPGQFQDGGPLQSF